MPSLYICPREAHAHNASFQKTRRPGQRGKNRNRTTKNSQHAPIPPKPLRGNVQAATDGAAFVVRPSHVDDQHRGDFHREDHLRALLGHDACFEAGGWEGGVPWLLFWLVLLGGGCHLGVFWGSWFFVVLGDGGLKGLDGTLNAVDWAICDFGV